MDKKSLVALKQLREIEKICPTPFYIYDERGIRENTTELKQAFSWNKGYRGYFAVKATPNPLLLSILKGMGCGTDCSSMTELTMFRAYGFSDPDIMFSSNDIPPEEFACAKRPGAIIGLDDITHIQCLKGTLGHVPETISCCPNPGGLFKISNGIMDNPGNSRRGMTTEQIGRAFKVLKEKGVGRFDIHVFLANSTVTNEYCPMLAKILFELTAKLKGETGVHITLVSLFSGIGVPYRSDQRPNDILIIDDGVRRIYEEVLTSTGMESVALCIELGRFMVGPYGTLVIKVIHEKYIYEEYVGMDAYAVNLMRPVMYGAYHHITVVERKDEPCIRMYNVVGSLYKNNDKFIIDCILPEVRKRNLLFIHDAGAHGSAMGYNYSDKLRSAELLLKESDTAEMIHRARTLEDCFAALDFCDTLRDTE